VFVQWQRVSPVLAYSLITRVLTRSRLSSNTLRSPDMEKVASTVAPGHDAARLVLEVAQA
jgi:hypothetical protein